MPARSSFRCVNFCAFDSCFTKTASCPVFAIDCTFQVCVKSCPDENFNYYEAVVYSGSRSKMICEYHVDPVSSAKVTW